MVLLQPSKMGKIGGTGHDVYGQETQVAQELLALRMSCLPLILAAPSNRCAKAWQNVVVYNVIASIEGRQPCPASIHKC